MSYLSQLKAKIAEIGSPAELPKLPEPGFDSFGSAPGILIPAKKAADDARLSPGTRLWLERIRKLNGELAPASLSLIRWQQLLTDAQRLLIAWEDQAIALGWNDVDLFAVPPGPERWGRGGLVMALSGRPVIAMTAEAATIQSPQGKSGAVLLWDPRAFIEHVGQLTGH